LAGTGSPAAAVRSGGGKARADIDAIGLTGQRRGRRFGPGPSILDGEAFPDFVDPLVERIEAGVNAPVMKVEDISHGQKSEDPVVTFDVDQHLLDRVTDSNNSVPQNVHRIPRFEKMTGSFLNDRR
jgi:hypothetical protein